MPLSGAQFIGCLVKKEKKKTKTVLVISEL